MLMHGRLFLSSTLLVAFVLFAPAFTQAHPPFDPYDDTRFAPITRFGPSIGIEVAAEGLTAPLKGVREPGQPEPPVRGRSTRNPLGRRSAGRESDEVPRREIADRAPGGLW